MAKIGRNSPCPCGSGKKYKRCCEKKEAAMKRRGLPPGRFRYESGSYGGPGRGYMPSIICYKELKPNSWKEHFCLVKPDGILNDENTVSSIAEKHLAAAQAIISSGGGPQDFALILRHEGYKNVTDFRVVNK
jgi:hypothetical protein